MMVEVKLQYRGKKPTFTIKNTQLSKPIVVSQDPVLVSESDAKWLLSTNPKMFHVLENDPVEEEMLENDPVEEEMLVCEKCGKEYAPLHKRWYEKHVEKCEG